MSDQFLQFKECDTRRCLNVTINNDMTLERPESFYIYVDGPYGESYGEIRIMDDDERKNLYT